MEQLSKAESLCLFLKAYSCESVVVSILLLTKNERGQRQFEVCCALPFCQRSIPVIIVHMHMS